MKDWEKLLCDYLNVKPLGLTASEIRCLQALGTGTEFSLTHLASKLDMEATAVRTNIEIFLLKKESHASKTYWSQSNQGGSEVPEGICCAL